MDTKRIRNVDISQIHHLPMIDFIGNDFAIFNDIKDMPLSSYPTRLNAACLTVCLKGWCKLELNLQQCEMREGVLGIILPDQIVLQRERSDDFSGLFIAVSKDFMDMVIPTMQQLFPIFFMIKERPFVQITPEESQSFQEYHSFLWSKVKLKDNPFRKEITQGLLLALFYEIYNIYQGHVIISDKIKESSLNIKELKKFIKKDFIILSGDNEEIVKEVANKVGINLFHGNLLPLDKVKYIKKYQQKGKVMFVGDGINDAPVLKISDIGISMGNIGTDAAIEASDIVLMNDNLLTIATAIKIAKKTKRKVVESIILALSVKFIVLVLGLFGMSTIYMAVFADVGVTFLVILNVLTIFYKKL